MKVLMSIGVLTGLLIAGHAFAQERRTLEQLEHVPPQLQTDAERGAVKRAQQAAAMQQSDATQSASEGRRYQSAQYPYGPVPRPEYPPSANAPYPNVGSAIAADVIDAAAARANNALMDRRYKVRHYTPEEMEEMRKKQR